VPYIRTVKDHVGRDRGAGRVVLASRVAGDPHHRDPGRRPAGHHRRGPAPADLRQTLDAINHDN